MPIKGFRVSDAQAAELDARAAQAGLTFSAYALVTFFPGIHAAQEAAKELVDSVIQPHKPDLRQSSLCPRCTRLGGGRPLRSCQPCIDWCNEQQRKPVRGAKKA